VSDSDSVVIALDAMGGDSSPRDPVRAAAILSRETNIKIHLFGRPDVVQAELDKVDHDKRGIEIRPATQIIAMGENPRDAVTSKKDASIVVAAKAVAARECAALVSAGSTGALVVSAAAYIPRIPGVKKAALAAVHPTRERSFSNDRFALILDVGASLRCDAEDLLFYAYMGHAYASRISKVPQPSIGLLNVGSEEGKGDEILTKAHRLLREESRLNFIGNVEGTDIPNGIADVIVCEGFVGNVVLKMAEGVGEALNNLGAWAFKQKLSWRLGMALLSGGLTQLKAITDYREYGGAPFLGFKQLVIKAHGRSSPAAIANAVKVAAKAVRGKVPEHIEESVGSFERRRET
jgi:glycerol-3-phosphate acyltransferase PlsX